MAVHHEEKGVRDQVVCIRWTDKDDREFGQPFRVCVVSAAHSAGSTAVSLLIGSPSHNNDYAEPSFGNGSPARSW